MRSASWNPTSGSPAIVDQTRMSHTRPSRTRNLIRSQMPSGLRVRRSSSFGRPPGGIPVAARAFLMTSS